MEGQLVWSCYVDATIRLDFSKASIAIVESNHTEHLFLPPGQTLELNKIQITQDLD